jgi:hypothetical protein
VTTVLWLPGRNLIYSTFLLEEKFLLFPVFETPK